MKRYSLIIIAFGLLAMACTKEFVIPQDDITSTPITITARYGGDAQSDTRVAYSESGSNISATWQADDQIYVVYDGHVNTLDLTDGAGTGTATFSGSIQGTPKATSALICYVKDQNYTSAATVNSDGSYTYTSGAFLAQDGTLAGAAKCNLYYGMAQYGDGTNISCSFSVNISMCKFNLTNVGGDNGQMATLTYKSGGTEVAKATFAVTSGDNLVYLSVPAGKYSGNQSLEYRVTPSGCVFTKTLSSSHANFASGQTYSKDIAFVPTLAQTLTTAGMDVKVNFHTDYYYGAYCTFTSVGDGSYTFKEGAGVSNLSQCAKALEIDWNGNLVFEYNNSTESDIYGIYWEWEQKGYAVTFNPNDNSYTTWYGSSVGADEMTFDNVEVNGTVIDVGPSLAQTLTTAGLDVSIYFHTSYEYSGQPYCTFTSVGDGTYTFKEGYGFGGREYYARALEDDGCGNLVFKTNLHQNSATEGIDNLWSYSGFSVTFNLSDNTYTTWKGYSDNVSDITFDVVIVNDKVLNMTPAQ